jgi:hypothetical protein
MARSLAASIATLAVISATAACVYEVSGDRIAAAQSRYASGTGRIRNVQSMAEIVTVRATWPQPAESADACTPPPAPVAEQKREYFVVTVQFNDAFYIVRAAAEASWNVNPTTFRFGESVQVSVNADEMILDRDDGTDFRGRVIRVQHDARPYVPLLM